MDHFIKNPAFSTAKMSRWMRKVIFDCQKIVYGSSNRCCFFFFYQIALFVDFIFNQDFRLYGMALVGITLHSQFII